MSVRRMKVVVAEDEALSRKRLVRLLQEAGCVVVNSFAEGRAAAEWLSQHREVEAVFLDIHMPNLDGLAILKSLGGQVPVVLVTAFAEHAVEAFDGEAVDYLLKPVTDERLGRTLARLRGSEAAPLPETLLASLRDLLRAAPGAPGPLRWIKAQAGQAIRLLGVDEICYFQASEKYTTVVTRDAELLIRTSIKELAEQLDPAQFWQIHRSTLVNVRQIAAARHDAMGRLALQLKHRPETLPVSRTFAHLFRQM